MRTAIVLFHYRRSENLIKQLNVLNSVNLPVFVFVDYDNNCDGENISEFEEYIEKYKGDNPDKLIELISQENNIGLRKSVLNGLEHVSNRADAFIVFEDDIMFNLKTIEYFETSLNKYNNTDVFHINGWCHPNWYPFERKRYHFGKWAFCWGWATWSNKWSLIQLDAEKLLSQLESRKTEFNIYGSYSFTDQLEKNIDKTLTSWAVFWTASIFVNKGKCLSTSVPHCKPLHDDKFTNASNILAYNHQVTSATFERSYLPNADVDIDQKESLILFVYVKFIHILLSKYGRFKVWLSS